MEVDQVEVVELELKYCERCGTLWLRLCGDQEVFCDTCAPVMSGYTHVERRGGMRLPAGHRDDVAGQGEELFAICCEGGNA